jgi:hypothetical protein
MADQGYQCIHCRVWYLLLHSCCIAHFMERQLPSPLKLFHSSVYCSRMQQLRVKVTVASYRLLQLAEYSHAQYKRYSVVIRRTVLYRFRQGGW